MKLDLYRRYKSEYIAPKVPTLVRVGPARYLSVRGRGDPNRPGFDAGPYDREHASFGRMEEFARSHRVRFTCRHHEICLSDPRRVAPAKLRTILRRPVR
ncbi:MAG: hypothetical protein ACM3OA_15815 [Acidobacteriota bacterium]